MFPCSSIGVEDVQMTFCDGLEDFAVPHLGDTDTERRSVSGSGHASNEGPLSSPRTNGELQATEIEPCMPQLLGQVQEPRRDQDGAGSRTAFAVNSNILRGVQTGVVLRRGARLLKSAAGSEATYLLSRPTDHLGTFISHNWSVGRSKKWLALCLHFNFVGAVVCGVLTAAVLCVASSLGWLPLPAVQSQSVEHRGLYCCVGGTLAFYVTLLFGSDVLPARFMRYHDVFLDKACIHQVDKTLQRKGIESLGAFLFYSWSMVVLYTPVYTTRVWTVYEMACFLSVHPGGPLVWLPVDLALAVVAASFTTMLNTAAVWAVSTVYIRGWLALPAWSMLLPYLPAVVCGMFILDTVVRDQVKSVANLRLFSIRNAVCAVEGDRSIVEGNVASLMRNLKLAPSDSTHEEALLTFDRMVQTTMPRAIRDAVGRAGLRYELLVTVLVPYAFVWFDYSAALVFGGASVRAVCSMILERSTRTFAIFPLGAALAFQMCARCAHLDGLKRIVFVLFVSVVWVLWVEMWDFVFGPLCLLAEEDIFAFVLFCLISFAFFTLTYLVFRRPPEQQRRRRTRAVSETIDELASAIGSYHQRIDATDVRRISSE